MAQVDVCQDKRIDSVLRRFKREVSKAGIMADVKKNRYFETPLEKRKRKEVTATKSKRFHRRR